jgi:hypothetical protein
VSLILAMHDAYTHTYTHREHMGSKGGDAHALFLML